MYNRSSPSSFAQAPEDRHSKNTTSTQDGPNNGPPKSAMKKKVTFDGVLMPPRDKNASPVPRNYRKERGTDVDFD